MDERGAGRRELRVRSEAPRKGMRRASSPLRRGSCRQRTCTSVSEAPGGRSARTGPTTRPSKKSSACPWAYYRMGVPLEAHPTARRPEDPPGLFRRSDNHTSLPEAPRPRQQPRALRSGAQEARLWAPRPRSRWRARLPATAIEHGRRALRRQVRATPQVSKFAELMRRKFTCPLSPSCWMIGFLARSCR
jgi:hypothetical protein